jgi:hypothetical protein
LKRFRSSILSSLFLILIPYIFIVSEVIAETNWGDVYNKNNKISKGWKYIVIHHSATDSGNGKGFHKFHTDQGYGGLSYHFVIGNGKGALDGSVYEGFRWKDQIAGTHVDINSWFFNIFGIGICLVGNFEKNKPSEKQLISLTKLVKKLMEDNNIDVNHVITHKLVPHGDMTWDDQKIKHVKKNSKFATTLCPGKKFSIKDFKKNIYK